MILEEKGAMPSTDLVLLKFEIRALQQDVAKDVLRIIQETTHHAQNEFRKEFPDDEIDHMFQVLIQLLFFQSVMNAGSEASLTIKIPKLGLIEWEQTGFEDRAYQSVKTPGVLTEAEIAQVQEFFDRNFPAPH